MSVVVLVLGPLVIFVAVGVAVLLVLALTRRPDHTLSAELATARRHGLATSVFAEMAFVAGTAFLAWFAMRPGAQGELTLRWIGAVPLIVASLALVALAVGELTWPRHRVMQRQANLNPRTDRDLVPTGWTRLLAGLSVVTVAVIAVGWVLANGTGGALTVSHPAEGIVHSTSGFPGSAFGLPQLLALACAGAPLAAVLCLVVLRPAVVRSDVATDNRLRAASAVRAVRLTVSCSCCCRRPGFPGCRPHRRRRPWAYPGDGRRHARHDGRDPAVRAGPRPARGVHPGRCPASGGQAPGRPRAGCRSGVATNTIAGALLERRPD